MPAKTPEAHFAAYPANTRIKHEVLRRYLQAYLTALSNAADAVHYIDGFAGRGLTSEAGKFQFHVCGRYAEERSAQVHRIDPGRGENLVEPGFNSHSILREKERMNIEIERYGSVA